MTAIGRAAPTWTDETRASPTYCTPTRTPGWQTPPRPRLQRLTMAARRLTASLRTGISHGATGRFPATATSRAVEAIVVRATTRTTAATASRLGARPTSGQGSKAIRAATAAVARHSGCRRLLARLTARLRGRRTRRPVRSGARPPRDPEGPASTPTWTTTMPTAPLSRARSPRSRPCLRGGPHALTAAPRRRPSSRTSCLIRRAGCRRVFAQRR